MRKCLLCLGAAVLAAAAVPGSAYGFTGTAGAPGGAYDFQDAGLPEGAAEDFDPEALERELRELMESGTAADGTDIQAEVSQELLNELSHMQKIVHPDLDVRWDGGRAMMVYTLPNQSAFAASVPDGLLTTGAVTFLPMENARATIRRSGVKISQAEDGVYREPGDYRINLLVMPTGVQGGDNNLYEVDFYFRIIPEQSAQVNLLKAPAGFYIQRLERDGTALKPENPGWHFLSQDGAYRVRFTWEEREDVTFLAEFTRDTKAPLLSFDPLPDRYEMNRTVHMEVDDPAAAIEMYYNGRPMRSALKTIELAGYYQYHLEDQAGNERYYAVKMAERFRMPKPGTIVIAFLGLAGAAAWMIYQRRHPRFL